MQRVYSLLGTEIVTSLAMLYLMLGAASFGVGLSLRAKPQSRLKQQVNAWWWIFPVVTLSLLLHPLGAWLLVLTIGALALRELAPIAGRRFALPAAAVLLATLALVAVWPQAGAWLPALAISALLAHFLGSRSAGALAWLLWLLLCFSTSFLIRYETLPLPPQQRLAWLFYLYVLTSLNDVAQFISGTLFGRHRIAPGISPNKTWQGLAGGVAVSLLLSLALGGYLQLAGARRLAVYALLLSLGGFCGDLMFSAAKRVLGVKDFSQLIPGHGGILDRVDSLVVTAPLLYLLITHT
ncbi:phosphatidate cytidylyltransferase [Pseudoduganella sp. LjRoot289]|uniref:phosphatidate cytidylyltransferase n=1 Tax=Pseudoduganella sp. LjRoot289 TaxID=3342314 RepID=UPI003ED05274